MTYAQGDRSLEDVASPRHWPAGDSVDMTDYRNGWSIVHDGTGENGRTHWYLDESPSLGE